MERRHARPLVQIGGQAFASAQAYWSDTLGLQKAIKAILGGTVAIASARLTTLATEAAEEALGVPPPKNVCEVSTMSDLILYHNLVSGA